MTSGSRTEPIETANTAVRSTAIWHLLLVSFAALYLEIVLIRWLGTEVKIFAFFQNLSLMVCFLGFGIGCFNSRKRGTVLPSLGATSALVVAVNLPYESWQTRLHRLSSVLSFTPDAALWGHDLGISKSQYYQELANSLLIIAGFLMLLCIAMIPLGRWVGYYLETIPNTVTAYSVNLLGSVAGIWLLAILAYFWLSPSYWFILAFFFISLAQPFSWRAVLLALALLSITLLALKPSGDALVYWSPYQKLSVVDLGNQNYGIDVNNEGYMSIANLDPESLSANPQLASAYQYSSYDSPFQFADSVNRVLVVGSGAGNDVAAALRHGASQVDAVEIDPLISTLGTHLHPEHPYSSPKAHLFNNDARNFLRQNHEKYDVIIFGLLDSHTEFSGYSNMRVDNYVYTEESFLDARRHLKPDGILVLKFELRKPWTWIGQRFYGMLSHIFPRPPLTYYADGVGNLLSATVFIESDSPHPWDKSLGIQESAFLHSRQPPFSPTAEDAPAPTTDDWPYVYHFGHSIPRAYFVVSAVVLMLSLYMVGPLFKPKQSSTWQFFVLGAGFLLMETQLVTRLGLFFGTTWLVNCVALTGILTILLISNVDVKHLRPGNLSPYYALVCSALVAVYLVPWARIPGSGTQVGILICFAYCVPFFFAGIIFTESFRRFGGRSDAFGANMLGAVAGGLTQNLSFVFGMKSLLLIAAAIYGVAALLHVINPSLRTTPPVGATGN